VWLAVYDVGEATGECSVTMDGEGEDTSQSKQGVLTVTGDIGE
jgi:hypothetical protein